VNFFLKKKNYFLEEKESLKLDCFLFPPLPSHCENLRFHDATQSANFGMVPLPIVQNMHSEIGGDNPN
jgi:hypothetical protein